MKRKIIRQRLTSGLTASVMLLLLTAPAQADFRPQANPTTVSPFSYTLAAEKSDKELAAEADGAEEADGEETDAGEQENAGEPEEVQEKERPEGELSGPEILQKNPLIAHGLGEVDGIGTLNCLEGFEASYAAGIRVFEVDLRLTRDSKVVLRHDWRMGWQDGVDEITIPTREAFLSKKILGKYTPLSFRDLLLLMEEYPDICVITDTKFTEADVYLHQFDAMVEDAKELGLSYLFDRFIFQIYNKNMFTALSTEYHFPHYIYTLYNEGFEQTAAAFREKVEFCAQKGIGGITMWDYWWKPAYRAIAEEHNIHVYVHTVNDVEKTKSLVASGVNGFYTDSMVPADFIEPPPEFPRAPVPEDAPAAEENTEQES